MCHNHLYSTQSKVANWFVANLHLTPPTRHLETGMTIWIYPAELWSQVLTTGVLKDRSFTLCKGALQQRIR